MSLRQAESAGSQLQAVAACLTQDPYGKHQPSDAAQLSQSWHAILVAAAAVVEALPSAESGKCVLDGSGRLFTGTGAALQEALDRASLVFHPGSIRGALPRIAGT